MFELEKARMAQLSKEINKLKIIQDKLLAEKRKIWDLIETLDHLDEKLIFWMEVVCEQERELFKEKNALALEKENIRIKLDAMQVGHQEIGELAQSANYQFACNFLPEAFLRFDLVHMDKLYKNYSLTNLFYMTVLRGMNSHVGFSRRFADLSVYYIKNKSGKGIVFVIPEAEQECECECVALVVLDNGEKIYYTNEYYAIEGGFKLCEYTLDEHIAYNVRTDTVRSFVQAIGFQFDGGKEGGYYSEVSYRGIRAFKEWLKNRNKANQVRKIRERRKGLKRAEGALACDRKDEDL